MLLKTKNKSKTPSFQKTKTYKKFIVIKEQNCIYLRK